MIKHNKHICEQLTAQYWDRTGLCNNLCLIVITAERISYFLTLEYCTLCCTFIFRQQQREFILWCNLFPLQTLSSSAHVYLCNYLWIIHAQILQSSLIISFCIHNSESTHTNTQIKPAINKPEVSHSNKIKEQQQKNWQWGKNKFLPLLHQPSWLCYFYIPCSNLPVLAETDQYSACISLAKRMASSSVLSHTAPDWANNEGQLEQSVWAGDSTGTAIAPTLGCFQCSQWPLWPCLDMTARTFSYLVLALHGSVHSAPTALKQNKS